MAAPSYSTDLATRVVSEAESNSGWAELSGHTSGGAATSESDYYLQGAGCVSQSMGQGTGVTAGLQYDSGANISWTSGYCFFAWQIFTAPNAIDTFANGGMRFGVGSTSGNMNYWRTMGSDFGKYPYGGWQNSAVDPTFTPDYTDGSPVAGNYRLIGSWPNRVAAVTKGNPHGVDVVRYGRGLLEITLGDLANGYGTFVGVATYNDGTSNRFGLFQKEGTGYLWKGLLSFGTAATACDFRDQNKNITVDDTPRTYAGFNKIEIRNASSRVDWTGISIVALNASQLSPGSLEVVDNADVNIDGCTFVDMTTFSFLSGSSVVGTTFRRCGLVTPNGAEFTDNVLASPDGTIAVTTTASNLANMQRCSFVSAGTGHGLEITGSAGEYSLIGHKFSGYAASNGSTGNEAVYVNIASGTVTLNVTSGGSTPSIRTAGATVVVVAAVAVTLTGLRDNTEVRVYSAGTTTELAGTESATSGTTDDRSFTFSLAAGTDVDIQVFAVAYEPVRLEGFTVPTSDSSVPIEQRFDRNYVNP